MRGEKPTVMLNYLMQWGHMYVMHFGMWMTFAFGATIYRDGLPELEKLPKLIKTAIVVSLALSLFSSHSHHYMSNIIPMLKE